MAREMTVRRHRGRIVGIAPLTVGDYRCPGAALAEAVSSRASYVARSGSSLRSSEPALSSWSILLSTVLVLTCGRSAAPIPEVGRPVYRGEVTIDPASGRLSAEWTIGSLPEGVPRPALFLADDLFVAVERDQLDRVLLVGHRVAM